MKEVREEMIKKGADMMVVTAADEVAWLLNLRGRDAKNTPGGLILPLLPVLAHHGIYLHNK